MNMADVLMFLTSSPRAVQWRNRIPERWSCRCGNRAVALPCSPESARRRLKKL